jgi:phytoene dehydrogenase-like protein
MSPGTAYVLLHHYMGEVDGNVGAWGYARGGMGAITKALAASLSRPPAAPSRTGPVDRVLSTTAGRWASSWRAARKSAPASLLQRRRQAHLPQVVGEDELPGDFVQEGQQLQDPRLVRQAQHRARRPAAVPGAARGTPCIRGDMHFTDTVERMERAYDDWKRGRWSKDPFLDMLIPTLIDPTMTPPGKHFMSVLRAVRPPRIEGRDWTDADRDAFARP